MRSAGRTLNGLALGEVVVLGLGKEAGFVSPDDALQEPTRNLHNQALLSEHERERTAVRTLNKRASMSSNTPLGARQYLGVTTTVPTLS